MKHRKNGNRYNDDFRKMIVDLYHSGQKVKDLSSEYGVSEVTIYSWIKKYTPVDLDDGSSEVRLSRISSSICVSIAAGETALTRIPPPATSRAVVFVIPATACFDAIYPTILRIQYRQHLRLY